jgi:hypothetical protein
MPRTAYQVTSRFVLLLNATVLADSLENATVVAKSLKWEAYGLKKLDCLDGSEQVVSVTDLDGYNSDQ